MKSAIDRFWNPEVSLKALAAFRVGTAALILYVLWYFHTDLILFFSDEGILSARTARAIADKRLLNLFALLPSPPKLVIALVLALATSATLLAFNFFPRTNAAISAVLYSSFLSRNTLVLNGGHYLVLSFLLFLIILPTAKSPGRVWSIRLAQLHIALVYFSTAIEKIHDPEWRGGMATYYVLGDDDLSRVGSALAHNHIFGVRLLTYATLVTELCLASLVFLRPKPRGYLLALGLGFHLCLEASLRIPVFQWAMLVSYFLFLTPAQTDQIIRRLLPGGALGTGDHRTT